MGVSTTLSWFYWLWKDHMDLALDVFRHVSLWSAQQFSTITFTGDSQPRNGAEIPGSLSLIFSSSKGTSNHLPPAEKHCPRDQVCLMGCVLSLCCVRVVKILRTIGECSVHKSKQFECVCWGGGRITFL